MNRWTFNWATPNDILVGINYIVGTAEDELGNTQEIELISFGLLFCTFSYFIGVIDESTDD